MENKGTEQPELEALVPEPQEGPQQPPPAGDDMEALAQRALLARPGVSIRVRLVIGFSTIFILATAAAVTAWLAMTRMEGKLEFLERGDKIANEIQQCRRYEKNFLLYGASLDKVLRHLQLAHKTLMETKVELGRVVGVEKMEELERHMEQYRTLIYKLMEAPRDARTKRPINGAAIESELRKHGGRLVDMAILMSKRERNDVRRRLGVMKNVFLISLGPLFLVMLYMASFLARHFVRRLRLLMAVTQRVGEGDFRPIMPVRKYRDEFTDLSVAMNKMMHELESRHRQLVQAGKIAAVGTLTAGIAHEINNPINNISMIIESLADRPTETGTEEGQRLLNEAMDQCDRVTDIVKNLLEFSRASHPRVEEASIEELVDKTHRLVKNELSLHQIKFVKRVHDQLPPLHVDRGGMQQVLLNLFLNAIHAMPDGGELRVEIHLTEAMNEGRVDISDTGVGVRPEHLDKIFDPFFTTKKKGQGTGLGLSVSYNIIKKHGGRMEVQSTRGEGTVFSIFLPFERPSF
jgi:signal transduction histidine kinase